MHEDKWKKVAVTPDNNNRSFLFSVIPGNELKNITKFNVTFKPRTACAHNYRPQRSCGKVMFLHLSVLLFTGGSATPRADNPPGQTPPDRHPPPRSACWELLATKGRYASYWNAHLFLIEFISILFFFSLNWIYLLKSKLDMLVRTTCPYFLQNLPFIIYQW